MSNVHIGIIPRVTSVKLNVSHTHTFPIVSSADDENTHSCLLHKVQHIKPLHASHSTLQHRRISKDYMSHVRNRHSTARLCSVYCCLRSARVVGHYHSLSSTYLCTADVISNKARVRYFADMHSTLPKWFVWMLRTKDTTAQNRGWQNALQKASHESVSKRPNFTQQHADKFHWFYFNESTAETSRYWPS